MNSFPSCLYMYIAVSECTFFDFSLQAPVPVQKLDWPLAFSSVSLWQTTTKGTKSIRFPNPHSCPVV